MGRTSGLGVAVAVAGLALAAWSCGDGGTGPDPEPDATGVRVNVTADGDAASGVEVRLFAEGAGTATSTATTGSTGSVTFADLAPGGYEVEITVPAGLELEGSARRGATVVSGSVTSVNYALTTPPEEGVVVVELLSASFSPETVVIAPGTTIRWRNATATFHTITPEGHSEWQRVEMTQQNQVFDHVFNTVGEYPYFCEPHAPNMTGVIIVEEGG